MFEAEKITLREPKLRNLPTTHRRKTGCCRKYSRRWMHAEISCPPIFCHWPLSPLNNSFRYGLLIGGSLCTVTSLAALSSFSIPSARMRSVMRRLPEQLMAVCIPFESLGDLCSAGDLCIHAAAQPTCAREIVSALASSSEFASFQKQFS